MTNHLEQLERDGYTVIPSFLDKTTTTKIRAHMDSLLPPPEPKEKEGVKRVNDIRHPIPGAIMAEILDNPRLLELARAELESDDLKLLEQVLVRTDPSTSTPGAHGWHIDMVFLPEHFHARPRQTYFHHVHILSDVPQGGGGTTIVPGSHHKTYAAAEKLGLDNLQQLKADPFGVSGADVSQAVELQPSEGDLLIFNPMCLHSASSNNADSPRYVYFASFYDSSAEYLQQFLASTNYPRAFPDSLRENLPSELQPLLQA